MWRRTLWICTLGSIAGLLVVWFNPVNSMVLKLALLGCLAAAWAGCLMLGWRKTPLRWLLLVLPMVCAVPLMLPGRAIDVEVLRRDYLGRMAGFEGTRYVWGGESSRGIDCSGLPRRALRDAMLGYGIRHLNGRAIRGWLEQWWFDASARALAAAYRNDTRPIGVTGTIREMDYAGLVPGDLAITTNGVHVLAYAGGGKWIQADPGIGAVATLDGRTADNRWFRMPVTIHRWRVLVGHQPVRAGENSGNP